MKYLFCPDNQLTNPTSCGFWPYSMKSDYVKAGTWPEHGVDVDDTVREQFSIAYPTGKTLGADENGMPCWEDLPAPTHDELVKQAEATKKTLMDKAKQEIIFLGLMGDTSGKLDSFKNYYNELNAIDTAKAPDINWPTEPQN